MASSTLSMTYVQLARHIGREIDASRDSNDWDAVQSQDIQDIIADGLRQVYWPPTLPGESVPHEWSFLQPRLGSLTIYPPYDTGTVAVAAGVVTLSGGGIFPSWAADGDLWVSGEKYAISTRDSNTQVTLVDTSVAVTAGTSYEVIYTYYDLPDDFGGMAPGHEFTLRRDHQHAAHPSHPRMVSESFVDRYDQWPHVKGNPELIAVVPTVTTSADTKWQIRFYPQPDQEYDLVYRYQIIPPLLTGATYVYHYGGAPLSQCVLMSCLDKAMRFLYSSDEYYMRFLGVLGPAVQRDRNLHRRETLGFGRYSYGYSRDGFVYGDLRDYRKANSTLGNIQIG